MRWILAALLLIVASAQVAVGDNTYRGLADTQGTASATLREAAGRGVRIYPLAKEIHGTSATIRAFLQETPVLSRITNDPEIIKVRQQFYAFRQFLISVLCRDARIMEAECQIVGERTLGNFSAGSLLGSVSSFKSTAIGIDDWLAVRQAHLNERLEGLIKQGNANRKELEELLADIKFARTMMGVPPRANTPEEVPEIINRFGLEAGKDDIIFQGRPVPVPPTIPRSGSRDVLRETMKKYDLVPGDYVIWGDQLRQIPEDFE